jgi:hypothetical protein
VLICVRHSHHFAKHVKRSRWFVYFFSLLLLAVAKITLLVRVQKRGPSFSLCFVSPFLLRGKRLSCVNPSRERTAQSHTHTHIYDCLTAQESIPQHIQAAFGRQQTYQHASSTRGRIARQYRCGEFDQKHCLFLARRQMLIQLVLLVGSMT